jgi:hypothetical protein
MYSVLRKTFADMGSVLVVYYYRARDDCDRGVIHSRARYFQDQAVMLDLLAGGFRGSGFRAAKRRKQNKTKKGTDDVWGGRVFSRDGHLQRVRSKLMGKRWRGREYILVIRERSVVQSLQEWRVGRVCAATVPSTAASVYVSVPAPLGLSPLSLITITPLRLWPHSALVLVSSLRPTSMHETAVLVSFLARFPTLPFVYLYLSQDDILIPRRLSS